MRTVVVPLALILALGGCAPGMYTLGAVPAAVVAAAAPDRDRLPVLHGTMQVAGRPQLPASGPLWSLAPAAPADADCAESPFWLSAPVWQEPPPWRGGAGPAGGCPGPAGAP